MTAARFVLSKEEADLICEALGCFNDSINRLYEQAGQDGVGGPTAQLLVNRIHLASRIRDTLTNEFS